MADNKLDGTSGRLRQWGLLKGSRLSNERIKQAGFQFSYSSISDALQDIFKTP